MKKHTLIIFALAAGLLFSHRAFADIGRIETKRERLARQSKETGGKIATDAYLKIHENFLNENYAEVDRLSKEYLSGGHDKPNAEDVLYLEALSLLKLGRGSQARIKFGELENSFTPFNRKASASASVADSYFYEGNYEEAARAYQATLKKYPNSDQTTYASYKLHEISAKLGKPMDPVVTSLRQQSMEEAPLFTVQVGSFSKIRNANILIRKLSGHGYDAYVEKDASGGMFRVRVGRFKSKAEALQTESRLKQEGFPTKIYP